jgi:hypothetical protein
MRQLTIAAVSGAQDRDGAALLLRDVRGEQFRLPVDERLLAVVRGELPSGQLQLSEPLALTPRDIQARVRAGATVDELVAVSRLPRDRVLRFAEPVLDERAHVAEVGRRASVRLADGAATTVEAVVDAALAAGPDATSQESGMGDGPAPAPTWDAWRREDGRWCVSSRWSVGGASHTALWTLDPSGRSAGPADDVARQVLGWRVEPPAPHLAVVPTEHDRHQDDPHLLSGQSTGSDAAAGADQAAGRGDGPQASIATEPALPGGTLGEPGMLPAAQATARGASDDDTPTGPLPVVEDGPAPGRRPRRAAGARTAEPRQRPQDRRRGGEGAAQPPGGAAGSGTTRGAERGAERGDAAAGADSARGRHPAGRRATPPQQDRLRLDLAAGAPPTRGADASAWDIMFGARPQ